MSTRISLSILLVSLAAVAACRYRPALRPEAEEVRASTQEPGPNCVADGPVVGYAGITPDEMPISDEAIEYAMNDIRNKAAQRSTTFVRTDPPQVEHGRVIVTGTAYHCMQTSVQ